MRLLHLDSRGRFDDANAVHYSLDFEEDRDDFSPSLGPTSMRWASRFSEGMSALGSDEEFQAEGLLRPRAERLQHVLIQLHLRDLFIQTQQVPEVWSRRLTHIWSPSAPKVLR
ncbi:hypothetical protein WJX84_011766 [Apatococcus fuscideae]|uniref:Uncharacterized protein n=1 Tax=Apatococcus fuscideae TaxID=2026836 RepID=A0AAW1SMW5_9CHLO